MTSEKIDLAKYMTVAEAMRAIGCSHRGLYRCMERIGIEEVSAEVLGRRLIRRDKLEAIKSHYYPHGSALRHEMAQVWGSEGGTQKSKNFKKRARAAKRAGA